MSKDNLAETEMASCNEDGTSSEIYIDKETGDIVTYYDHFKKRKITGKYTGDLSKL